MFAHVSEIKVEPQLRLFVSSQVRMDYLIEFTNI